MSKIINLLTESDRQILINSADYRDFLKFFIKPHSHLPHALNYAEFSRRSGFSSRAFPRDICLGNRAINMDTLPQFIKGLGLTGDWKDFFTYLVQKDLKLFSVPDKVKTYIPHLNFA